MFLEVLSVVAVVGVTLTQLVRRPFDLESGSQCTPHYVPWMAVGMRVSSVVQVYPLIFPQTGCLLLDHRQCHLTKLPWHLPLQPGEDRDNQS